MRLGLTTRTTIVLLSWYLIFGVQAAEDSEGCNLYMAPSSLPGAGTGLYIGQEVPAGSTIGSEYSDLYVPIKDKFKTLPYRGQQQFLSWLGYIWPEHIDAFHHTFNDKVFPEIPSARYGVNEGLSAANTFTFTDGNGIVSAFSPGIASLVNSHPYFANLKKNGKSERVDDSGLSVKEPFSPFHGVSFIAKDDLEAGTELLIDYGFEWNNRFLDKIYSGMDYAGDGSEECFQYLPNEERKRSSYLHNKRDTQEILQKLERIYNQSLDENGGGAVQSERNLQSAKEVNEVQTEDETELEYANVGGEDEGSDGFNDDEEEGGFKDNEYYDEADDEDEEGDYPVPSKEIEWLKENGMCIDNLRGGRSTIPDAGGGSFAQRQITKGSVIAPAPLLAIKRTDLDILQATRNEGQYRAHLHPDKVVGHELLLNYCFGHKDSPLLLLPYTPVVNFINHDSQEPNAFIRWTENRLYRDPKEWLEKHPLDVLNESGRLMMEFVALRDLQPGEEIFIDYGEAWALAWRIISMVKAHHGSPSITY